jgi:tetratricopeptide (TPR) repeat protein
VVAGAINRAGSGYVLSARLVAAETGNELYSLRETAEGLDPIIPAIDRLSGRLRERIGESLRAVRRSPPLRQVRTASLEALRLHTEAYHASLRGGEEWRRVLDLNSRAVEIDTAFAAAYRAISEALDHLGWEGAVAAATRAYELRQRQLLWEQYATEGYYHGRVTGDRERKINAYLRVLDLRPDHEEAIQSLGTTYANMRQFDRAEEMFRRRVELDSLAGPGWYELAAAQFNQGKYDEAEETLRRWEANMPEHHAIQLHRARFASARGDYDAAEQIMRDYLASQVLSSRSRSRGDRISWLATFAQVQGKLAEAERIRREAMRAYEEAGLLGMYLYRAREIAWSYLRHADAPDRALDVAEAALQRHPLGEVDSRASHALGFASLYATAGRPNVARELIAEYEAVAWEGLLNMPRGWVALAEGRPQDAIQEFSAFLEGAGLGGYLAYLNPLGRGLEAAGEPDSAIAVYESYVNTPYDRKVTIDQLNLPFAYERLGNLYEQCGDTAKAILYYGKLVDLWKDADPELQPRVEAARRAIDALSPDR